MRSLASFGICHLFRGREGGEGREGGRTVRAWGNLREKLRRRRHEGTFLFQGWFWREGGREGGEGGRTYRTSLGQSAREAQA